MLFCVLGVFYNLAYFGFIIWKMFLSLKKDYDTFLGRKVASEILENLQLQPKSA
jgi:hypothetical protein